MTRKKDTKETMEKEMKCSVAYTSFKKKTWELWYMAHHLEE